GGWLLFLSKAGGARRPGTAAGLFPPLRAAPSPAAPRKDAAPADLGGRPQQVGAAPGGPIRRRLASSGRQPGGALAARGAAGTPRRALSPRRGTRPRPEVAHHLVQGAGLRPG